MATKSNQKVSIIGSGLIGRSWAMLFATAGYNVVMYDVDKNQLSGAMEIIKSELENLASLELLKGTLSKEEIYNNIKTCEDFEQCVTGAFFVQECVPEQLELKTKIFKDLDKYADDSVILSSSASCIPASKFTENLQHRSQMIVSHPTNPPFYCPLTELIPAPWTHPDIITGTKAIMEEIGQVPVVCHKEVPGFVLNRIQYAILNEAWRLVQDGVMSAEDVDKVMSEGMGPRYAFMGPLETAFLNAEGWYSYSERYAEGIETVSKSFGPTPNYRPGPALTHIHEDLCSRIPLDKIKERRAWRDKRLAALAKLKKNLNAQEK